MTVFYTLGDKLYVNITNRCSCDCVFCLRGSGKGVGSAETLWLEREPDLDEIKTAFGAVKLDGLTEVVFCGYGEPTERAEIVIAACEHIKSKCNLPVRLNTNGLVKLIEPAFILSSLEIFDSVSISLNAADEEEYLRVTKPKFGTETYSALLDFAREAKKHTNVFFTVVDVIGEEQVQKCRELAKSMEIPLRVRHFVGNNESYS
ncbi:MAG: TatD family nuclease-associated radical SAM protein [Oscillospiraceae bacterium]|jgi:TatD family-associated radical SAM protein|nr:TatD family nuclease-associated radical SAM protein [Oscillospiraceae bacterium]